MATTRRRITFSTNVERARILDWQHSVAKAVNDNKATRRQLEELQRHDRAMKQGCGLYLAPYKYGLYLNLLINADRA